MQIQFQNYSEVKLFCSLLPYMYVGNAMIGTDLCVEKSGYVIGPYSPVKCHCTAILTPIQGSSYGGLRRAGPPTTHDLRPAHTHNKKTKKNYCAWHYVS